MEKSKKLEKFLTLVSNEKSGWLEKMKIRQANQASLKKSGKIPFNITNIERKTISVLNGVQEQNVTAN